MQGKTIISCAITGSIHTPSISPHLPVTAEQIAHSALEAAEAGAAIVHLHARNPEDGRPDQSPETFQPFLRSIKQSSDVVVNITNGGSPYMSVEQRISPAERWKPEVASLNMGSMSFGLFPMLKRYEKISGMLGTRDIGRLPRPRISQQLQGYPLCSGNTEFHGNAVEFECYDTGHLHDLYYFWSEGLVKAPLFIQNCFDLLGGIGPHPEEVLHMRRTADRLFGDQYHWSVLGAGQSQLKIAAQAVAMGGMFGLAWRTISGSVEVSWLLLTRRR